MSPSPRSLAFALLAVLAIGSTALAGGEVVEVNSLKDLPDADVFDGVCDADLNEPGLQCTLRAAVMHLNAGGAEGVGTPQIMLPEGTIKLKLKGSDEDAAALGDLDILVPMDIVGMGCDVSIIDGGGAKDRVFDVFAAASFTSLTIQKGKAGPDSIDPDGRGGGIRASADVTLSDVVMTRNSAPEDGGAMSVHDGATATVDGSLFVKNKVKDDGGAIDVRDSTLVATDTTFERNKAGSEGGAIEGSGATIDLTNVTIVKNKAKQRGAAINLEYGSTASLLNSTLSGNRAKEDANLGVDLEGAEGVGGDYTLENTILFKKGKKAGNCATAVTSLGGNIENGDSCGFGGGGDGNGDLIDTDPLLAKKAADNGGFPVRTLALDADSPAIDFANDGNCPPQDARGVDRVDVPGVGSSICDSGAYEFEPEPTENLPPMADAGPDQMVTDTDMGGDEDVTLDGSGSSDTDGTIMSWVWMEGATQIGTGETPMVTLAVGMHTIELTVMDDDGDTDTDTVVIDVLAGGMNQPPMADAGPDQMVTDVDMGGDETVTLDGSGSSDTDGTIMSWVWMEGATQVGTGEMPMVTLAVGMHTIELTVTDDDGDSDTDTVVIDVEAGAPAISYANDIQPYFNANCTSCHSGGGPGGVDLDSWANVLAGGNNGALVVPFDSTQGTLLPKMQGGHQGAPHGTDIIDDIAIWVDAGALDN